MVKYPRGNSASFRQAPIPPHKKSLQKHQDISFSDRGMNLEQQINESNHFYHAKGLAVVHKKPTPIQIVKVDYPKRSRAVIKEAYFRQASTTDYNGVYHGYYLDFEAKETKNKTNFPLKNFHEHQIVHLQDCLEQGGICFVIIKFTSLERYFVLPAKPVVKAWQDKDKSSITLEEIINVAVEIKSGFRPTLPYLTAVDYLITGEKKHEKE